MTPTTREECAALDAADPSPPSARSSSFLRA